MDTIFDRGSLTQNARIAAEALNGKKAPTDRSFEYTLPENLTQEAIDDLVLQAHMVAPVWSDYAIVRERADIWGMVPFIYNIFDNPEVIEGRVAFSSDDCLVVASENRVEMLITVTPIGDGGKIFYQMGIHLLTVNPELFLFGSAFRELTLAHGLLAYPDSALIDQLGLWQTGKGAVEYIQHKDRVRPIFLFDRSANLPTKAKKFQRAARVFCAGFGPIIVNDLLFKRKRCVDPVPGISLTFWRMPMA